MKLVVTFCYISLMCGCGIRFVGVFVYKQRIFSVDVLFEDLNSCSGCIIFSVFLFGMLWMFYQPLNDEIM